MDSPRTQRTGTRLRVWLPIAVVVSIGIVCLAGVIRFINRDPRSEDLTQTRSTVTETKAENAATSHASGEPSPLPLFEEVPAEITGVNFTHRLVPDHERAYLYHSGYTCGGVCLGDINNDGLCDIFLVSGPDENAFFLNQGGFVFEKSPASQVVAGRGSWGVGASLADVDGDGDLDLFVCNYDSPNRLWLNEGTDASGQLRLTECSSQAGVLEVAEATLRCFRRTVPAAVPGIVFLSGGQSSELATAHLNEMNKLGAQPWQLS